METTTDFYITMFYLILLIVVFGIGVFLLTSGLYEILKRFL